MATRINPFHELYVGESVGPDKFVHLFSDIIVSHALALFQPGHVILKGLPGSGKSMLLNLLKPSVRIAYENSEVPFPVPEDFSKFIGAGINLKRSGISDFGQRPIGKFKEDLSPLFFADFLNYWVVSDIFHSLEKISRDVRISDKVKKIGINLSEEKLKLFTREVAQNDCWFNYLDNIAEYEALRNKLNQRITLYRSFLNYNIDELPEDIQTSKTVVGVPISKVVQLLKKHLIIDQDTEIFIRIDQYEELVWLDEVDRSTGSKFQEIIHKLLGMRDTNVSYRIGARNFAWTGEEKMFGTTAILEKKRNYIEISIDSVLRRQENSRAWIFPKFAEDIFARRIMLSSAFQVNIPKDQLISHIYGNANSPAESAREYIPNNPEKALVLEDDWPVTWKKFLKELSQKNPLSARLGEAWARQKGKGDIVNLKKFVEPYPWEEKKWWRKERIEQALMQIASRNQQQMTWYGKEDILGLSGGHILIFLSLSQHIWDVWIRDKRNGSNDLTTELPKIDKTIQSIGIKEASFDWFEDISNVSGGKERKAFIWYLGILFHKFLIEDKSMSYPGNNGFSLTLDDLQKDEKVYNFLINACNYGDLYDMPHTSKSSDKKPRRKFYLTPILSPYFKIPFAHTKEPIYVSFEDVVDWLIESKVFQKDEIKRQIKKKKLSRNVNQGIIEF